jgi:hypothetical protein
MGKQPPLKLKFDKHSSYLILVYMKNVLQIYQNNKYIQICPRYTNIYQDIQNTNQP